ncbi:MAG TPA: VWA domain-containing protein, partial [Pirellulaceae bacterium]|nr:VWA domain-containing protein [Pirellulaceae bacterium]
PAGAQSVVMFRGNEFSAPAVRGAGGLLVRHLPANVDTAKVTVFGDRPQQASVMFILDCSASMSEQIRVEAATKDLIPRMDFAKAALKELLGELAQGGRTRVGVRFFGHRVGWTKTSPVKILKQPGYVGELPDNVTPSGDVELILPLGRFDLAEAGRVEQAMANVRGWGQSPLYYALQETLTDFAVDVKESDKSVVVITDGENYQFSPTESAARAAPKTTLEEIVASYRGTGIRVYILGFGIDSRTSPRAEPEFRRIARETGGEYFNVDNARDLLKRLRSRLGLGLYFVDSDLSSSPGLAAPAGPSVEARDGNGVPLNLPYEISGLSSGVKRLAVRSEAARELVVVEGGESLELQMSSNGQELLTRPFDKHTLAADVTTASGRGRGMTLRVHHWPRQEISSSSGIVAAPSQQLPLAISIQDEQRKFTRRPAEMWVELTPLVEGDKGVSVDGPRAPLVLYDTFFAPGTPVPVVAWPLVAWPPEDWPAEARRARVDAWFKFERTAPGHVVTLAQVLREPKRFAVGQSVPELPGVVYQIRLGARTGVAARQTIEVVEQMSEGATLAFPAARVQIETEPALRPQLTERRFDASLRTAVHTFVFSK